MRYVREQGYPAPEVVSVAGADLVLERATGTAMRVDIARRPWTIVGHARLLADLHRRLHRIPAPDWLPAIGPGGSVIHVAQSVVILAAADLPWRTMLAIRVFLRVYLASFDGAVVRAHLPAAIARRMADPNMTARERELISLVRV